MENVLSRARVVRRVATSLVVLAMAGGGLAVPASAQGAKTIRAVMHADLQTFDPIWTTADIVQRHALMVYDMLFALDDKLQPQPEMVGSHTLSPDGKTYTFTLRDGLKFHDGAPVTAGDVVPSLQRWAKRDGAGQTLATFMTELVAVDAKTIRMVLREPWGLTLDALAKPGSNVAVVMPKRIAETDPFQQIQENIGSGPFTFNKADWVPGAKVVYRKNPAYAPRSEPASGIAGGKTVKVDIVEFIVMPDPATTVGALQKNEIDFYENPPIDFVKGLRATPGVKIENLNRLGSTGVLRINWLQPPFNNVKARQGLEWLVNQTDYLNAIQGDPAIYKVCGAFLVCGSALGSETGAEILLSTAPEAERIARAKALFAEAGYKGEPIVLLHPTSNQRLSAATLVLDQALRKAGLNVKLDSMDWGTLVTRRAKKEPIDQGGWSLFHTSSGGLEASDPAFHIPMSAGCDKAWFGWPCDEQLEKLRADYSRAATLEERKKVAEAIQKRAMEIVLYIPFGMWTAPAAYRDSLKGVIAMPDATVFWNIDKS